MIGGSSPATFVRMSMDLGKVSLANFPISLTRCPTWSSMRSPLAPRANERICLTISAPRWALAVAVSNISLLSLLASSSRIRLPTIKIGPKTLFKSWAIPPASAPMFSILWARNNCDSISFFSVMSVLMTKMDSGFPDSLRIKAHRLSTTIFFPPLVTWFNSPCHSPWAIIRFRAAKGAAASP